MRLKSHNINLKARKNTIIFFQKGAEIIIYFNTEKIILFKKNVLKKCLDIAAVFIAMLLGKNLASSIVKSVIEDYQSS